MTTISFQLFDLAKVAVFLMSLFGTVMLIELMYIRHTHLSNDQVGAKLSLVLTVVGWSLFYWMHL